MDTITSIQEKIRNAKSLDFGTVLGDSIELFKKTWLQGFLLRLFTTIIMLPLIIAIYVPLFAVFLVQVKSGESDPEAFSAFFAGFSIIYIIFFIVGIMVLGAVSVALNAAFYRIMKRLDYDESVEISDFFYFLNGKYLTKAFLLMLISILIAIPAALLCFVPLLYVMVPMSLFAAFFAYNPEMPVGDIVKASFSLGNKKWLLLFGLIIVASILSSIIGGLLCGIGMIFTAAFVYHPIYLVYKNVVGFDNDDSINHIVE